MKFTAKPYNLPTTMKKYLALFTLLISMADFSSAETIQINKNLKDSIGIERVGTSIFILHKVEAKETLYSLSRRYNVTVSDIVKHNPDVEAGLKIDNTLKIPYKTGSQQAGSKNHHTVAPSQTLFAISRMYNVSVDDIKRWNNLSSNDLSVGQVLVVSGKAAEVGIKKPADQEKATPHHSENVNKAASGKIVHKVAPSQTLFSISQLYSVTVEDIKQWNKLSSNSLDVGEELIIMVETKSQPYSSLENPKEKKEEADMENVARLDKDDIEKAAEPKASETIEKKPESKKGNSSGFKKVVELGMAEIIENVSDTKKYVALHRTAPIGTIMQVTNEMNNQNVFVRVIGKLPATGANDKVLIKLSKPAFERLGAVNDRFPAEISYVP